MMTHLGIGNHKGIMMTKEDIIKKWEGVNITDIENTPVEDLPILLEPFTSDDRTD